jgi:putative tryptophan/tyrosine transport system substrate-binding protein
VKRREFIAGLGSLAAWPLAARAQQPTMPVIGYLSAGSAEIFAPRLRAFRQGLSELGYFEGRNLEIEYRWTGERYDQLPAMAADLVRRQVAAIVADGPAAAQAKAATSTIPIVFWTAGDPVEMGLVPSLSRSGSNMTGVTSLGVELTQKRVELLHEMVPAAKSFALLVNSDGPTAGVLVREFQAAARTLGLEVYVAHAGAERDLNGAFETLSERRPGGLIIMPDLFLLSQTEQLAALALRHAVPAIFQYREFGAAGGLMSYGASLTSFRTVGVYIGRILKGERPSALPVQQVTKLELVINLKTAKALGLTIPETLLATADEVIQ